MDERSRKRFFEELVDTYQGELFRYAFCRTGSRQDAEDILHDVFVKIYKKDFGRIGNVRAYLYRAVANACIDMATGRGRLEAVLQRDFPAQETAVPECDPEVDLDIIWLLKKIPLPQAEIITLRIVSDLQFTQIAQITSLPLSTVKSRYKYGLEKIRDIIKTQNTGNHEL